MAYRSYTRSSRRRSPSRRPSARSRSYRSRARAPYTKRRSTRRAPARQQTIKVVLQMVNPAGVLPIGQKEAPKPKKARF